ncbi:unnamed protein product [Symbiodinium microadriaticum]|nr:unnamed protein product [Symbiodinium microadriaticum]
MACECGSRMEQLIIEDGTYKHKIQEEKRKREQADEFQRQVGNYAKEQKITRGDPDRTAGACDGAYVSLVMDV